MNIDQLYRWLLNEAIKAYKYYTDRAFYMTADDEDWEIKLMKQGMEYLWQKAASEKMLKIMEEIESSVLSNRKFGSDERRLIKVMLLAGMVDEERQKTMELLPTLFKQVGYEKFDSIISMYVAVNFNLNIVIINNFLRA
ncbi:hypothetical protein [Mycoplasma sp. 5370]